MPLNLPKRKYASRSNEPAPLKKKAAEEVSQAEPQEEPQVKLRPPRRKPLTRFTQNDESPGFYLSFSDLMCLLLVFFVLIFSLSKVEVPIKTEEQQASGGMGKLAQPRFTSSTRRDPLPMPKPEADHVRRGFMMVDSSGYPDPGLRRMPRSAQGAPKGLVLDRALMTLVTGSKPLPPAALPHDETNLSQLLKQVRQEVQKGGVSGLEMQSGPNHLVITLPESITFDTGRAQIKPSMRLILAKLARILAKRRGYRVIVTGHTDDVPIHNQKFHSNWELSAARAAAVGRALFTTGLDQGRLTIRGMADQKPRVPNSTAKNRQQNRRVEIELRS
jgi:chemotaxis protein MotB